MLRLSPLTDLSVYYGANPGSVLFRKNGFAFTILTGMTHSSLISSQMFGKHEPIFFVFLFTLFCVGFFFFFFFFFSIRSLPYGS